ncbi:hypothetical protein Dimus_013356, partial [Dionaea muscipula]
MMITREHKQECFSVMEKIFGDGPSMEGDFIVINFFALLGSSDSNLQFCHNLRLQMQAASYGLPK